ncbi:MAG: hypothetical protein C1943_17965 [Halochromatium sp.]|nr:hypothetical protein [Halochromatium sp.]
MRRVQNLRRPIPPRRAATATPQRAHQRRPGSGAGNPAPAKDNRQTPQGRSWRRPVLLGLVILMLLAAGLIAGSWWLTGSPWPLAGWGWLQPRFEQIEPAPLKSALDRSAFAHARRTDTEAAYQAYLEQCRPNGCRYRAESEARITALQESAEQALRAAQLEREAADLDAYSQALNLDTEAAYLAYLDRCALHDDCLYRGPAQQRLDALEADQGHPEQPPGPVRETAEQAARATELEQQIEQLTAQLDQIAFAEAQRADTEAAYRAYLKACAKTGCWHRAEAKERLAQLNERARRFAYEPEMAPINAGCFQMSIPASRNRNRGKRTEQVCVAAFQLARHEVTFSQYDLFARSTGREPADDAGWGRGNRPVINVSWEAAMAYAAWLGEQTGRRYRLPTEAEWEYAARAGTETLHYWGDDRDAACAYANVHDQTSMRENSLSAPYHDCDDGYATTAPVGQFQPNAWGLYDMLGNVWEWTCSVFSGAIDGTEQRCATASQSGFRAIRGGAWHSRPQLLRAAGRSGILPDQAYAGLGFRLAEDG